MSLIQFEKSLPICKCACKSRALARGCAGLEVLIGICGRRLFGQRRKFQRHLLARLLVVRFAEVNFRFRVPVDLGQVKARRGLRRRDGICALLVLRRTPQPPPGLHYTATHYDL